MDGFFRNVTACIELKCLKGLKLRKALLAQIVLNSLILKDEAVNFSSF